MKLTDNVIISALRDGKEIYRKRIRVLDYEGVGDRRILQHKSNNGVLLEIYDLDLCADDWEVADDEA